MNLKIHNIGHLASAGLVSILIVMISMLCVGCSDETAPVTDVSFGEITWPKHYYDQTQSNINVEVNVLDPSNTSGLVLWAVMSHTYGSGNTELFRTNQLVGGGGTRSFVIDLNDTQHDNGEGKYIITFGLYKGDDAGLYSSEKATVFEKRIVYIGSQWFEFDMDVEYSFQGYGSDPTDNFLHWIDRERNDFDEVKRPYSGTKVNFIVYNCPKNPSQPESVKKTDLLMWEYRKRTATYWDAAQQRPKTRFFLATVLSILDANGMSAFVHGCNSHRYGVAFVSPKFIRDTYSSRINELCYLTAAHELGHLVGDGLTDYCLSANDHTPNDWTNGPVCMMTGIGPAQVIKDPYWSCSVPNQRLAYAGHRFCDMCKNRLKEFDFLQSQDPDTRFSTSAPAGGEDW